MSRNLQVTAIDHFHSIPPHNFIKIRFYKKHSKIWFLIKNGKSLNCAYLCNDDQTLKVDNSCKRYYFDIELKSESKIEQKTESKELLESTQFKIVVDRYALLAAAFIHLISTATFYWLCYLLLCSSYFITSVVH